MISVRFQGKPFNITVIQACAPTSNAEEAEVEWFYEGSTRPFRTNTQKRCPFHYRGQECKSRKSRNTRNNRKFGLGVQNEAGQRLIAFCQENALVIATPSSNNTWTLPDGQHRNQIDYIICSQIWRSSIQ